MFLTKQSCPIISVEKIVSNIELEPMAPRKKRKNINRFSIILDCPFSTLLFKQLEPMAPRKIKRIKNRFSIILDSPINNLLFTSLEPMAPRKKERNSIF